MAYIVLTTWFPLHKAPEVAKKYFEVMKKYPADETLETPVVPLAVTTTQQGVEAFQVFEVKEGKLEESLTQTSSQLVEYHGIEGFAYTIRVYSTMTEAFALLGLKVPE